MAKILTPAFHAVCMERANSDYGLNTINGGLTSDQMETKATVSRAYNPMSILEYYVKGFNLVMVLHLPDNALYRFIIDPFGTYRKICLTPELLKTKKN